MDIPNELQDHIKKELKKVKHGRITVEINETRGKIDVITEARKRFPINGEKKCRNIVENGVNRNDNL